jgi:hypothetical protein
VCELKDLSLCYINSGFFLGVWNRSTLEKEQLKKVTSMANTLSRDEAARNTRAPPSKDKGAYMNVMEQLELEASRMTRGQGENESVYSYSNVDAECNPNYDPTDDRPDPTPSCSQKRKRSRSPMREKSPPRTRAPLRRPTYERSRSPSPRPKRRQKADNDLGKFVYHYF